MFQKRKQTTTCITKYNKFNQGVFKLTEILLVTILMAFDESSFHYEEDCTVFAKE